MTGLILSPAEVEDLTGYSQSTKQLRVLHSRGFVRAYINRRGIVVIERAHYEAVCAGQQQTKAKSANLAFLRAA